VLVTDSIFIQVRYGLNHCINLHVSNEAGVDGVSVNDPSCLCLRYKDIIHFHHKHYCVLWYEKVLPFRGNAPKIAFLP
jgi:hypothetical protein